MESRAVPSVVILGASNVRLGLSPIVQALSSTFTGPLNLFVAGGHGRSYGLWTWIPFRGLPGIVECGLWNALGIAEADPAEPPLPIPITTDGEPLLSDSDLADDASELLGDPDGLERGTVRLPDVSLGLIDGVSPDRETPPTADLSRESPPLALITDVGNDLVYGVDVPQILSWVETCLRRLARLNADVILTLPPLNRLQLLSNWRYVATRTMFFPGSRVSWPDMLAQVRTLDDELRTLGRRHGAQVFAPLLEWYGVDPIHVRRSLRRRAWERIFLHWPEYRRRFESRQRDAVAMGEAGFAHVDRPPFLRLRAHVRRGLFGERITKQPVYEGKRMALWLY